MGIAPPAPVPSVGCRDDPISAAPPPGSDDARHPFRCRQIFLTKCRGEYRPYIRCVPLEERRPKHPVTPPTAPETSNRGWRHTFRAWRVSLHRWGPGQSTRGSPPLLACGDVEPNPGPPKTTAERPWRLTPDAVQRACALLQLPSLPVFDAFGTTPLAGSDSAWSGVPEALLHPWIGETPLWMNPPPTKTWPPW